MNLLQNINRLVLEPKIYALLAKSKAGEVLHIGVHFSLDEAYSAVSKKIESLPTYEAGQTVDLDLWNCISGKHAIAQLIDPSKAGEVFDIPKDVISVEEEGIHSPVFVQKDISELPQTVIETFPTALQDLIKRVQQNSNKTLDAVKKELAPKKTDFTEFDKTGPTFEDHLDLVNDSKNKLMQKLIEDGDVEKVEKVKNILNKASRTYVLKAIEKNKGGSV